MRDYELDLTMHRVHNGQIERCTMRQYTEWLSTKQLSPNTAQIFNTPLSTNGVKVSTALISMCDHYMIETMHFPSEATIRRLDITLQQAHEQHLRMVYRFDEETYQLLNKKLQLANQNPDFKEFGFFE